MLIAGTTKNLKAKAYKASKNQVSCITKGDSVRIYIRNPLYSFDTKIAPNWSKDVYKVTEEDKNNRR